MNETAETVGVVVNGEARAGVAGATLLELLENLALDPRSVVVEHDRRLVRRPAAGDGRVAAGAGVGAGFTVLAYTNEDLVTALRLEDVGVAAVMPLASPIGSGLGLLNPYGVRLIKRRLHVPVVVDAGVGTASDACVTMEQGVDGILMNTALAAAHDPVAMAHAMRLAVEAGRTAYLAGRMPRREVAVPSSPLEGMLD